ncbi:MAG: S8 family serine peptidase [Planctomycetota bacterium]
MRLSPLLLLAWVAPALAAQGDALSRVQHKLHPYLTDRLRTADADEHVGAYFVIADRLGYHHWFPRVQRMSLAERQATVMRELREHAARTQADLLRQLDAAADSGACVSVRSNWLGNFVQVSATRDVIARAAAVDGVAEVWSDHAFAATSCEDGAAPDGTCPPENGPAAVGADRVWALGFCGEGITVMNADSGINVQHRALQDRVWVNGGEIPANGIDDDGNGFIDDIHGWDFGLWSNDLDDRGGHGTSTAGVLVGDCACGGQTLGIAPGAQVMTGKLLNESSQWWAVQYAIEMGAQVQTSSHSYKNNFVPPPNYEMHRYVADASLAYGLVRTNSTSNNGGFCDDPTQSIRRPFNVSAPANVPAPYLDPAQTLMARKSGVIAVGAFSVSSGALDGGSPCGPSAWHLQDLLAVLPSYGLTEWDPDHNDYPWFGGTQLGLIKPDVVAPTGTMTTVAPGTSCLIRPFGGTSNATPIVAGCAVLWKSANPSLTPEDVAMIVHTTSNDAGLVPGKENTWGAGRVDALAGVQRALAVHRVNGEPAWQVRHRSGRPLEFAFDGASQSSVVLAVGLVRESASLGVVQSGIGSSVWEIACGSSDANGDLKAVVPVPPVGQEVRVFSQAFVDDRAGATGMVLASNVIEIVIEP